MADILSKVETVVLVMFENRSFDHLLGHLRFEGIKPAIDGLQKPLTDFASVYKGDLYPAYPLEKDGQLQYDLPHEWNFVTTQLAQSSVTGQFNMNGFVDAYIQANNATPNPQMEPMAFYPSNLVPMSSFLAQNFCMCERWFASLPSSTQPNRTMAFCGESAIFETKNQLIGANSNIFDWMDHNKIRWRVYHDGLSFFVLYPDLWKYVLSGNFRDYSSLDYDMKNEPSATAPQVILIEPNYQDSPRFDGPHPNDNHAPLAIGWGEDFLKRTYQSVTANAEKWNNTVMVVYYDEHGGFYDHVQPPLIPYQTTGNPAHSFDSLGVRIPGLIASPFVEKGSVCDAIFDHTSVLQFLAEKFTPGTPYSASVEQRSNHGKDIKSISVALTNETSWPAPVAPDLGIDFVSNDEDTISNAPTPNEPMRQVFEQAAFKLLAEQFELATAKYPGLQKWASDVNAARKK
jgi:phospholipase C